MSFYSFYEKLAPLSSVRNAAAGGKSFLLLLVMFHTASVAMFSRGQVRNSGVYMFCHLVARYLPPQKKTSGFPLGLAVHRGKTCVCSKSLFKTRLESYNEAKIIRSKARWEMPGCFAVPTLNLGQAILLETTSTIRAPGLAPCRPVLLCIRGPGFGHGDAPINGLDEFLRRRGVVLHHHAQAPGVPREDGLERRSGLGTCDLYNQILKHRFISFIPLDKTFI